MDILSAVAWFEGLAFPLLSLGVLVVWAYTLADFWKSPSLSGSAKAIVLLPLLGSVVYLSVREDW